MFNFLQNLHPLIQGSGTIALGFWLFYLFVVLSDKISKTDSKKEKISSKS